MKKLLFTILFTLVLSGGVSAETVLLKCKYLDGTLKRFKDNKFVKEEKPINPQKEYEIKIDPVRKKIIEAPFYDFMVDLETWQDDYILWMYDSTVVGDSDVVRIFNLDRVTGILSENSKGLTRIVEDGKYVKKSNGEWLRNLNYQEDLEYQCKKEDRLF